LQGLVFPAPVPIFAAHRSNNEYVALGLAAALALTRLLKTWLFVVGATDSPTFLVIALLLTFIALLACWIPARSATRGDPLMALHQN
jgi:putative ABC transport system permease protein